MTLYRAMKQLRVKPSDIDLVNVKTGQICHCSDEWDKGKLAERRKYTGNVSIAWAVLDMYTLVLIVDADHYERYNVCSHREVKDGILY